MEVTLLGTGCPQVSTQRYGPSNLVRYKDRSILIDCGSGCTQRLLAAGVRGADLEAVFLTHLHSDHAVDLFQLIISGWHQGRARPLRLFGPPGTQRFVDALMAAWEPDLRQRVAFEQRVSTAGLEVEVREIDGDGGLLWAGGRGGDDNDNDNNNGVGGGDDDNNDVVGGDDDDNNDGGDSSDGDDLRICAFRVSHQPVEHAFGFVLEAQGQRLAFSGDTTAPCPALLQAARGAHVLVHECFIHREIPPAPARITAQGQRNIASYHTLSSQVGKVAAGVGAGCLVLNHFVPVEFDRSALVAEVRRDYGGPIVVGEDLMRITLATGEIQFAGAVFSLPLLRSPAPPP